MRPLYWALQSKGHLAGFCAATWGVAAVVVVMFVQLYRHGHIFATENVFAFFIASITGMLWAVVMWEICLSSGALG